MLGLDLRGDMEHKNDKNEMLSCGWADSVRALIFRIEQNLRL